MIRTLPKKKILLIDDQPVCYLGLHRILKNSPNYEISFCADSIPESLNPSSIDLVILDICTAKGKGLSVIKEIKHRFTRAPLLILTSHNESLFAERCLKSGAYGFVMKTASEDTILHAIEEVTNGSIYVSSQVKSLMLNRLGKNDSGSTYSGFERLSDRELLVVEQIGLSKNNKEIAKELQINIKTIESHRSRIKAKLRLGSAQELMRYAMKLHHA